MKLPIVTQPSGEKLVKLFVGRSEHTDRLKIDAGGLKHGAYRVVSGDDWLAFIGDDTDFTPIEPWARHNGEIVNGRADLDNRLAQIAALPDQPEVHLRPNKLGTYKHVAGVMASAQRLGVTKIGLVGNEQFMN